MDLVFLDANILFSAAYRPEAGLRTLWELEAVALLSSAYAVEEARRNLPEQAQQSRLAELLRTVRLVPEIPESAYEHLGLSPSDLPTKDLPILAASIAARATHLLTGDVTHFGHLFGRTVGATRILTPAEYIQNRLGEAG